MKLLQGQFKWAGTKEEYEKIAMDNYVTEINKTPGLHWKIWAFDDKKMTATGIYIYKDEASAVAAKKGHEDNMKMNRYPPQMSDMKIRIWDIQVELSRANKAPI